MAKDKGIVIFVAGDAVEAQSFQNILMAEQNNSTAKQFLKPMGVKSFDEFHVYNMSEMSQKNKFPSLSDIFKDIKITGTEKELAIYVFLTAGANSLILQPSIFNSQDKVYRQTSIDEFGKIVAEMGGSSVLSALPSNSLSSSSSSSSSSSASSQSSSLENPGMNKEKEKEEKEEEVIIDIPLNSALPSSFSSSSSSSSSSSNSLFVPGAKGAEKEGSSPVGKEKKKRSVKGLFLSAFSPDKSSSDDVIVEEDEEESKKKTKKKVKKKEEKNKTVFSMSSSSSPSNSEPSTLKTPLLQKEIDRKREEDEFQNNLFKDCKSLEDFTGEEEGDDNNLLDGADEKKRKDSKESLLENPSLEVKEEKEEGEGETNQNSAFSNSPFISSLMPKNDTSFQDINFNTANEEGEEVGNDGKKELIIMNQNQGNMPLNRGLPVSNHLFSSSSSLSSGDLPGNRDLSTVIFSGYRKKAGTVAMGVTGAGAVATGALTFFEVIKIGFFLTLLGGVSVSTGGIGLGVFGLLLLLGAGYRSSKPSSGFGIGSLFNRCLGSCVRVEVEVEEENSPRQNLLGAPSNQPGNE